MDGLVQTVLSGNIFIQTQCFQKVVKLCFGVWFEPDLRCLLSSKKFHESVWKATAPEPVCGQRQCLIGRIVGNQRSETPDQSAARSTTLGHFLQRSNEGEGEQKENSAANKQKGEVRVALEILDQSTARKTRHNTQWGTKSRERAGRRGREKAEQRQNRNNRRSKGAGAKDTERRGRTTHQTECTGRREEREVKKRQSQSGNALSKIQRMAKGE